MSGLAIVAQKRTTMAMPMVSTILASAIAKGLVLSKTTKKPFIGMARPPTKVMPRPNATWAFAMRKALVYLKTIPRPSLGISRLLSVAVP